MQGVGFREFTRAAAERRGLAGWVRNRSDGTVEARLVGSAEQLSFFASVLTHPIGGAAEQDDEAADPEPDPAPRLS